MAMPANPPSAPLGSVMQADRAPHPGAVDFASGGATIYDGESPGNPGRRNFASTAGANPSCTCSKSTLAEVHSLSKRFISAKPAAWNCSGFPRPKGRPFNCWLTARQFVPRGAATPTVARVTWVSANELSADQQSWCNSGPPTKAISRRLKPGSLRFEWKSKPKRAINHRRGPQGAPAPRWPQSRYLFFVVVGRPAVGTGHRNLARATVSSN